MDEFEDYKEIGGRCDRVYNCDICEECEYSYDEDGSVSSMTRIFEVGDQDICEFCLRKINDLSVDEIVDGLK